MNEYAELRVVVPIGHAMLFQRIPGGLKFSGRRRDFLRAHGQMAGNQRRPRQSLSKTPSVYHEQLYRYLSGRKRPSATEENIIVTLTERESIQLPIGALRSILG